MKYNLYLQGQGGNAAAETADEPAAGVIYIYIYICICICI